MCRQPLSTFYFFCFNILCDTEWCTDLILSSVTLSDISTVIKFTVVFLR